MSHTPQISFRLRVFSDEENPGSWQWLLDRAQAVEHAGFDRLVLSGEHIVFGDNLDAYDDPKIGGMTGGKQPTGPNGNYLETLTTMSVIVGLTRTIRLSNMIMLAALRRPLILAKQLATLDVLSGGRIELGVGIGSQREEFEAAGIEFERRGRLLDHTLEVCQTFWRDNPASYQSAELAFEGLHMMPKPLQEGGVPLWISGTVNPAAMRRLARFGYGWVPWADALYTSDGLLEAIPQMREAVAALGRDPGELRIVGMIHLVDGNDGNAAIAPTMEAIPRLLDAGVTDFHLPLDVARDPQAAEDELTPWVAAFREATS